MVIQFVTLEHQESLEVPLIKHVKSTQKKKSFQVCWEGGQQTHTRHHQTCRERDSKTSTCVKLREIIHILTQNMIYKVQEKKFKRILLIAQKALMKRIKYFRI